MHHLHAAYRKRIFSKVLFIFTLVVLMVVLSAVGLTCGPMKFSLREVLMALANGIAGSGYDVPAAAVSVVVHIRLPRVVLALLSGYGLAVAGMQMQVILRNPLASPFTLGVSAGAGLGAGIAILSGVSIVAGRYMLVANAFVFALIPCAVIFLLSKSGNGGHGMLILAGIAMNFIFSSASSLLSYFSSSEDLKALTVWMMGNLGRATWSDIAPLAVVLLFVSPFLFSCNQKLNVLNSGDESARGLGVDVERTRITVLLLTSLVAAAITCFTGIIGFVGLVAPHIVRLIIGNDARYLMPAAGLFGAVFLLAADILAVTIIEPAVMPVGIITSFVGGPVLLYLIVSRQRSRSW